MWVIGSSPLSERIPIGSREPKPGTRLQVGSGVLTAPGECAVTHRNALSAAHQRALTLLKVSRSPKTNTRRSVFPSAFCLLDCPTPQCTEQPGRQKSVCNGSVPSTTFPTHTHAER